MNMEVSEIDGKVTCVRLQGRLDAPGAEAIGLRFTATVAATGRDAVVDLSGVTFLASMGIRLLISNARTLSTKGAGLVLFGAGELVQDVLEQAAIDQIIPLVRDESQALAHLST